MKIGLFGIGAIGSTILYNLQEELELFIFNRSEKKEIVFHYKTKKWRKSINKDPIDINVDLDWLIICLKEYQFDSAIADLGKLIKKETKIAIIRNGLDHKKPILHFTEEKYILECIIDCPVENYVENIYSQLNEGIITLPKGTLASQFSLLFNYKSIRFNQTIDFLTDAWKKLIDSSSLGGIMALTSQNILVFKNLEILQLYREVIREGILVAKNAGAKIDVDFERRLILKLETYPNSKGSSMLTDRLNNRPIEINAKNGIISEYGKRFNILTPLNDMITTLLAQVNQ